MVAGQDGDQEPAVGGDLSPRTSPALTATEAGLFVYGGLTQGGDLLSDGAVLDTDLQVATPLPPSPFSAALVRPTAVAAGADVIVAGAPCPTAEGSRSCQPAPPEVAVFNFDRMEWTQVEVPPEVATAKERIETRVLGESSGGVVVQLDTPGSFWLLDPVSGRWSAVAPLELQPFDVNTMEQRGQVNTVLDSCVAGDTIVVIERLDGFVNDVEAIRTHRLDPASDAGWVSADYSFKDIGKIQKTAPPRLTCLEDDVMMRDGGSAWNGIWQLPLETGVWSEVALPDVLTQAPDDLSGDPASFSVWLVFGWSGSEFVLFNTSISDPNLAYNPDTGVWREAAPPASTPDQGPVWTGDGFVAFAGDSAGGVPFGQPFRIGV